MIILKNQILAESKRVKYKDVEDLVFGIDITCDEIVDLLEFKLTAGSTTEYILPPNIYEIIVLNLMIKSLLPNEVKVNITIDDIKLRSILTTVKTVKFTENFFPIQNKVLLNPIQEHKVILKYSFI